MRLSMPRVMAFILGLGLVVLLAMGERRGIGGHFSAGTTSLLALFHFAVAGFLAGGAMVMPGVSGAYMFLLTGTYGSIYAGARFFDPASHPLGRYYLGGNGRQRGDIDLLQGDSHCLAAPADPYFLRYTGVDLWFICWTLACETGYFRFFSRRHTYLCDRRCDHLPVWETN